MNHKRVYCLYRRHGSAFSYDATTKCQRRYRRRGAHPGGAGDGHRQWRKGRADRRGDVGDCIIGGVPRTIREDDRADIMVKARDRRADGHGVVFDFSPPVSHPNCRRANGSMVLVGRARNAQWLGSPLADRWPTSEPRSGSIGGTRTTALLTQNFGGCSSEYAVAE